MFSRCKVRRFAAAVVLATLAASLLAQSPAGAQEEPARPQGPPPDVLDRPHNGQGAVNALGDRLPEVAAAHGMRPNELARTFREDLTLWVDPTLALFYIDPAGEDHGEIADEGPAVAEAAPFPLEDTFLLESRQDSQRTIFLDFDGHTVTGTAWNNQTKPPDNYDTGPVLDGTPYDIDGDPETFSDAERENIQDIWRRVAEDYAPFDVNVTTKDPGYGAINRSDTNDEVYGTRVLIDGGTPAIDCGCGGIAYLGVFDYTGSNHDHFQPAWVFQQGTGSPKSIAEAASHEVGHNLDLRHDGTSSLGYYEGHGAWAPIMGVGYSKPLTQWSKGEYTDANELQDDFVVMQANGSPLMTDDHGDSNGAATALGSGPATLSDTGLISTRTDVDVFSFVSAGGVQTIGVDPAAVSPNLDVELELYDSSGALVAADDEASLYAGEDLATGLDAQIVATLDAETYYVHVDGTGVGDVLGTGYSDYASLGRYTVTVSDGVCSTGDDTYEDNDGATAADLLVGGQSVSGKRCVGDDDWFVVPGIAGATLTIDLTGPADGGDLDVELLDGSLTQQALSASVGTTTEQIIHQFAANEDHYLRVHSTTNVENYYELSTSLNACAPDDKWEEDDHPSSATTPGLPGLQDGVICPGDGNNGDFVQVPLVAGEEFEATLHFSTEDLAPDLLIVRYPESTTTFSAGVTWEYGANATTLRYTSTEADDYQLWLRNEGSLPIPYRLEVSQGVADVAPTVSLDSPAEGATVRGVVELTATATDDLGVDQVEFLVDGVPVGLGAPGASDTWSLSWNSAGLGDGQSHVISAVATDTGAQTATAMSNVTILSNAVADFDGDGDTDVAVFRPSQNRWFIRGGETVQFGGAGDVPVPGDYDGDGVSEIAVFRPVSGQWFIRGSAVFNWGGNGDKPIGGRSATA